MSQFLSQSDDPSQASQCSSSIVIFVGEKEREVPDRLTVWSQGFVYDNNNEELRSTNQDGYGQDVNHAEAAVCGYVDGGINAAVILFELNSSSATCSLPETAKNKLREALGFSSKTALGSGITILPLL